MRKVSQPTLEDYIEQLKAIEYEKGGQIKVAFFHCGVLVDTPKPYVATVGGDHDDGEEMVII